MPDAFSVVVVVALVVVALLVVAVLVRMGSIAGSRDAALREAADLRGRLEMLAASSADFERDLRQDLANARNDQALAGQASRTELGTILGQQAQMTRDHLQGIARVQNEQMREVADRVSELTKSNEQRLDAVRTTVEGASTYCATTTRKSSSRCARRSTRSCRTRSMSGSANRSSRWPTGWSRCTKGSATCRASPSALAISSGFSPM
jgi:hypothetical protein